MADKDFDVSDNLSNEVDGLDNDKLSADFVHCPCCGKPTLKKPVKPGDELLDQWLACTATGVPFSHVYSLYGGRVTVTAVQPDATAGARVAAALSAIDRAKDIADFTELSESDLSALANAIRLFSCVREIAFTSPVQKKFDTGAAADQAIGMLVEALPMQRASAGQETWAGKLKSAYAVMTDKANISTLPTGVLLAVGQTHAQITDILMSAGFDRDFWQGIELA